MRVLHIIDALGRGGAERMLVDIARQTLREGHEVAVCITRSRADLADELEDGIALYVLGRTHRFSAEGWRGLRRVLAGKRYDLTHVHSRSTLSFLTAAKLAGIQVPPIVFHDHFGGPGFRLPTWFRFVGRHIVAQYAGVSEELGDSARNAGLPPARVNVIPNAIDLTRVQGALPAKLHQTGRRTALVVASLRPAKGIHVLLEAVSRISAEIRPLIMIAGSLADSMYVSSCRNMCDSLGLRDTVSFLGERTDTPSLIAGVDFGVVPSISESGPLVLIEFLAAGRPVVATLSGGVARIAAREGVAGMIPPGNVTALRDAVAVVMRHSTTELRERGELGRRVAGTHFDLRRLMPRWYELYARACNRG